MPDEANFDLEGFSAALSAATGRAAERAVAIESGAPWAISGVLWRTGLIVTAHEGLPGEEEFGVLMPDGQKTVARLVGRDPSTDVALLSLDSGEVGDWTVAPMPQVGSLALTVGRGEFGPLAAFGAVAEAGPAWRSLKGGLIDARLSLGLRLTGGLEGGAVVAPDGKLIGLAVSGPRGRALAIPATTVERAVNALGARGYVARGYLGLSVHPVAGKGSSAGAIVVGLEPEGPAAKAGLAVGDIITTWGGEAVANVGSISGRLGTDAVGQLVKLGVLRGGNAIDIDVTIGERPRA